MQANASAWFTHAHTHTHSFSCWCEMPPGTHMSSPFHDRHCRWHTHTKLQTVSHSLPTWPPGHTCAQNHTRSFHSDNFATFQPVSRLLVSAVFLPWSLSRSSSPFFPVLFFPEQPLSSTQNPLKRLGKKATHTELTDFHTAQQQLELWQEIDGGKYHISCVRGQCTLDSF